MGAGMKKAGTVQALKKASAGLLFRSETDAPFEWRGEEGKPTKARVLQLVGAAPGTPTKARSLDAFFRDATREQDWHDDKERAEVQRFQQLVETIKETLSDVKVFQVGRSEADVYIVGRTEEGWAGLRTKVVET